MGTWRMAVAQEYPTRLSAALARALMDDLFAHCLAAHGKDEDLTPSPVSEPKMVGVCDHDGWPTCYSEYIRRPARSRNNTLSPAPRSDKSEKTIAPTMAFDEYGSPLVSNCDDDN